MNQLKLESMLKRFFLEDIGDGDISGERLFAKNTIGTFSFHAKEEGIFCGEDIITIGFSMFNNGVKCNLLKHDGDLLNKGDLIAEIEGPIQTLLAGERVILNLVQRMSGIATATKQAVNQTVHSTAKICDTRKTTPGLRMLEKYAVRMGGAFNHRNGLYDCVMLKDNHIAFAGSITSAVNTIRSRIGHTIKIETEIETKAQLIEAIEAGVDIIMFDNRTPEEIKEWLPLVPLHITTEVSGGIQYNQIKDYAATGVDWISLGSLTHSVKALDISALVQLKGVTQIAH
ncbi:carboxylating nicotinate-nucleotide diphosphorylase [Rummeliibacillus sp. TYF005]|uniref:carboxylating nicotinate-nucleotide diphosphorylase n=1 Tax=unclassified Rummeliibacillus TaxID=2622809 RepID=UPI000E66ABEC|nr:MULTISPECIES: carboxylating nicotinate-nucleotide diphosphorylase [unclassified Rummeliibacillus]RIJ64312.1 carboxylating nicotinate-nucleotide diphosphorylase [Rummeliibacillus sp. POC4]RPJ94640.1 carboxylating nicotinate-nucleotide diphosphorylase [Rummeliibacillus sp. TYF005]